MVTKLTSSVDGIVWLLPFVAGPHRGVNMLRSAQYVLTMLFVAGVGSGIALIGDTALSSVIAEDAEWSSQRVLSLVAGVALSLYSVFLFREFWVERRSSSTDILDGSLQAATCAVVPHTVSSP
jgi:hypothetical protein